MRSKSDVQALNDEIWLALWDILLASGADPSSYACETRTRAGRVAGYLEFKRTGTAAEVIAAVEQLRDDYDGACEDALDELRVRRAAQAVVDAWKQGEPETPESVRMRALAAALNREET